jgi:hypothetical protein
LFSGFLLLAFFDFFEAGFGVLFCVRDDFAHEVGNSYVVRLLKVEVRIRQERGQVLGCALVGVRLDRVFVCVLEVLGVELRNLVNACKLFINFFDPSELRASSDGSVCEDDEGRLLIAKQLQKLFFLDALAVGVLNRAASFVNLRSPKPEQDLVIPKEI